MNQIKTEGFIPSFIYVIINNRVIVVKKGFTLIELLAVILILGIIALIAIPTVNNILKEARRGAFSSTLTNIEKAIENECTLSQIKNKDINYTYTITDGIISPSIEIKGDLPDGTIYVDGECKVNYTLYNNNFSAFKELDEIRIEDKKIYTEDILNGAVPVLSNNLVPVTIDNDGTVRKADIYSKWYSYEEKKWANAVILTETGKIEDDGTILENSIESYFVWIPRYKYKLFDMGNYNSVIAEKPSTSNAKSIEIMFENKNNDISVGTAVGEYHSHPAFQSFDSNGLWVGKFETTGASNNIQIKPNNSSLRTLQLNTMFELAYNYKQYNNSHMMKNTEWGAVAYLSISKYGIDKEININNNSEYMTGYSAVVGTNQSDYPGIHGTDSSVTLPYNTETGYLASTTGNITGVYDMSGGAHEYMASFKDGSLGNSGFTSDPTITYGNNYFDKYLNNTTATRYNNRILGDATGELGPFYSYTDGDGYNRYHNSWWLDNSYLIESNYPWSYRGGTYNYGLVASQLSFFRYTGESSGGISFRLVLSQ